MNYELIMQNKPNFQKSQMSANLYDTTDYENISDWTLSKNKPNSNPIKPNQSQFQTQNKPNLQNTQNPIFRFFLSLSFPQKRESKPRSDCVNLRNLQNRYFHTNKLTHARRKKSPA